MNQALVQIVNIDFSTFRAYIKFCFMAAYLVQRLKTQRNSLPGGHVEMLNLFQILFYSIHPQAASSKDP
jgi:hypothetical protein